MTATVKSERPRRRMTFEEAELLDPDEQPGEIVDGEWIPATRSTWRHGAIASQINFLLQLYAREHKGWSVSVADAGVKLSRNPDRLRGPDMAVVRAERVPKGKGVSGWLDGAPDVAVEVVGDAQSISDMTKKALEYLAAGAKMVWVVDVEPQRVVLFTPPIGCASWGWRTCSTAATCCPASSAVSPRCSARKRSRDARGRPPSTRCSRTSAASPTSVEPCSSRPRRSGAVLHGF